jgi:AcrR family transcriptional regulator
MPRSGREAHERLQRAALELYVEQGFDQATTAEIAERAGVTERTFFRHFPDKREVLFGGEAFVRELLVTAVDDTPMGVAELGSLEVLRGACLALEEPLVEGREFFKTRHAVIAVTPVLRERDLAKTALLAEALASALSRRGVGSQQASLAARAAVAAVDAATTSWYEEPSGSLRTLINQAFDDLFDLTTAKNR